MRACESISRERQTDEKGVARRGGTVAKLKGDARRTRRRMCFESKTGGRQDGVKVWEG